MRKQHARNWAPIDSESNQSESIGVKGTHGQPTVLMSKAKRCGHDSAVKQAETDITLFLVYHQLEQKICQAPKHKREQNQELQVKWLLSP